MTRITGLLLVFLIAGCTTMKEPKALDTADARSQDAVVQITGQCHCGNIKYMAQGPIVKCSYCDCGGCQRATGTLKAPFVTVKRQGFVLTAGEPASFRAESGVGCDCHGVWNFCPKCGTQVFWKGHTGDELDIFAGTLDDTTVFRPKQ